MKIKPEDVTPEMIQLLASACGEPAPERDIDKAEARQIFVAAVNVWLECQAAELATPDSPGPDIAGEPPETGPVYNVELVKDLPLGPWMRQAMPDRSDLRKAESMHLRVVAGYEVLLASHHQLRTVMEAFVDRMHELQLGPMDADELSDHVDRMCDAIATARVGEE